VLTGEVLEVIRQLKRRAPRKKTIGYMVVRRRLRRHGVQSEGKAEQGR
jgi:hypothetical protein